MYLPRQNLGIDGVGLQYANCFNNFKFSRYIDTQVFGKHMYTFHEISPPEYAFFVRSLFLLSHVQVFYMIWWKT